MRRLALKAIAFSAVLTLAGTTPVFAADAGVSPGGPAQTEMTDDGLILVTPAGNTLYVYSADDSRPGESVCTNMPRKSFNDPTSGFGQYPLPHADVQRSCAQQWPPYMADAQAKPQGDFTLIDRPEGGKQWAFRGHPLYLSIKDHRAGDRNAALVIGQAGRGWHFATVPLDLPPGLKMERYEQDLVLATSNHRPVYTPAGRRVLACQGCEDLFQPLLAPAVATVHGKWSITDAGVGREQYAFKGKRLYAAPNSLTDSDIAEAGGWEVVLLHKGAGTPPEIRTHITLLGHVYTDKSGKTLYMFTCGVVPVGDSVRCDEPGDAAQYWTVLCGSGQECARRWQPYLAPPNAHRVGEWSVVDVAYPMFTDPTGFTYPPEVPRVKAWAYRGAPMYTYYEDKEPGDIFGNGVRLHSLSGFYAVQVPMRGVND